mgnify:CR=1 FL=1
MNKDIIPAIIAKNQEELDKRIETLRGIANTMQLDVMDDAFVPNRSLDFDFSVPKGIDFEGHLMVQDPARWLQKHMDKIRTVLVHAESGADIDSLSEQMRGAGKRFGIALNPETPLDTISKYIGRLDELLIMTVNPGFYGSPFVPSALDKVKEARARMPDIDIEVDGSINDETISDASKAGANLFVVGSYLQKARDIGQRHKDLKKLMEDL